jgi:hypothetical protein
MGKVVDGSPIGPIFPFNEGHLHDDSDTRSGGQRLVDQETAEAN